MFSVCTRALICEAAGLLRGRRATTHWSAHHLLPLFGATPIDARVVVDRDMVFAAGVTAGIDGALTAAAQLRGEKAAQVIQLYMEYAPDPPFDAGTPSRAPEAVRLQALSGVAEITARREAPPAGSLPGSASPRREPPRCPEPGDPPGTLPQ